ncbi:ImmA/IrrE family metallo-endopeptidase [Azospirillum sp. INR13]|uniref:ImmA/IrrE family metallo-endopeptidase n=1 Tax=Azospirillum sp. INR13 TaxID=2596919 RepID=UPI00189232E6|nr:ImmA/IrrE family metallo-endopeptidase [Azospirillum sp. INR13]MBF5093117.1 ImmA/IrrE family metallo-endopeptidase [Azospirillum sp. INR13]
MSSVSSKTWMILGCWQTTGMLTDQRYRPGEALLDELGIRRPEDIDLRIIAAHLGLRIRRRCLDGCVARLVTGPRGGIITVSPDASGPRRSDGSPRERFSIAHEIGHWTLGHIHSACAHGDIPYGRGGRHEAEANAFASGLLLPDTFLRDSMPGADFDLGDARTIARQFGVSITAAALRLVDLSLHPVILTAYNANGLAWWRRSPTFPRHWRPVTTASTGSYVHEVFHDLGRGLLGEGGPHPKAASSWFAAPDADGRTVIDHTLRAGGDGSGFQAISLVRLLP